MKKKRGSSLAYVLLITAGVMVVGTTCLSTLSMGLKTTIQENKRVQSLYGADAGIEWAKSLLIGTFQTATQYAEQQVKEMEPNRFDKSAQAVMNSFKTFLKAVVDFFNVEVFKVIINALKPILTAIKLYIAQLRKPIKWRKSNKRR